MEKLIPRYVDVPYLLVHLLRVNHFAEEIAEGNEHCTVKPCVIASETEIKCS